MNVYQASPKPNDLNQLVVDLKLPLHPKWRVYLAEMDRGQGCTGLTLVIGTHGYDSYHPDRGENYGVNHYFPVPAAAYNRQSWQRWLFDRILDVETHELMEGFVINGERPYAPNHGPGHDPYVVRELNTEENQKTSFKGTINP